MNSDSIAVVGDSMMVVADCKNGVKEIHTKCWLLDADEEDEEG
jgi:hypothetical protein